MTEGLVIRMQGRLARLGAVLAMILSATALVGATPADAGTASFKISVTTCDRLWAGTNSSVYVTFITGSYRSPELKMNRPLYNDFRRGLTTSYQFHDLPIPPKPVDTIRVRLAGLDAWCMDRAYVFQRRYDTGSWLGVGNFILNDWVTIEFLNRGVN